MMGLKRFNIPSKASTICATTLSPCRKSLIVAGMWKIPNLAKSPMSTATRTTTDATSNQNPLGSPAARSRNAAMPSATMARPSATVVAISNSAASRSSLIFLRIRFLSLLPHVLLHPPVVGPPPGGPLVLHPEVHPVGGGGGGGGGGPPPQESGLTTTLPVLSLYVSE